MAFSANQNNAINAWIKAHNPKCPICGTANVNGNAYHNFLQPSEVDPLGGAKITGVKTLWFGLICQKCGFVSLIDIDFAKIPGVGK